MGFRTLLEINHDTFSNVLDMRENFAGAVDRYTRAADPDSAAYLQDVFGVRVVALRLSGNPYVVSSKADGFPVKAPFEEELAELIVRREAALSTARAMCARQTGRLKIDDLLDVIAGLVEIIDDQEMRDIMRILFERYRDMLDSLPVLLEGDEHSPAHLRWMCEISLNNIAEYPTDKLNRWLSYVQCDLTHLGLTTVETERNFTRPLFHAYYAKKGLSRPPTLERN